MIATLFGWRRRSEPFEWHKYVRTTIKLRREARREKAERMKRNAAEGAKVAGMAAGVAARKGAQNLGAGSRVAAVGLGHGLRRARAGGASVLAALGRGLARIMEPLLSLAARPSIGKPMAVLGGLLISAGLLRIALLRLFDNEARFALFVGALGVTLAFLPRPLIGRGLAVPKPIATLGARRPVRLALMAGVLLGGGVFFGGFAPGIGRATLPVSYPASAGATATLSWPSRTVAQLTAQFSGLASSIPFVGGKTIEGRATVIGADLVRVGTTVIRLTGIEPPARDQICTRPGNKRWRCNETAALALAKQINGRALKCATRGNDSMGNAQGTCVDGASDIGAQLVKGGHVFAASGLLASYAAAEAEAKTAKLNLWSAANERPGDWRAKVWADAKQRAPSGCPIKGQAIGAARTYVLPWSTDYDRVRVNVARGGRWFCTEDEAKSAGWKVAGGG